MLIYVCNYHSTADNPHYKAYLIKVVEVAVLDAILCTHVSYKPKPHVYKSWVFIESPLKVVGA